MAHETALAELERRHEKTRDRQRQSRVYLGCRDMQPSQIALPSACEKKKAAGGALKGISESMQKERR
jgi:hypothetical protein